MVVGYPVSGMPIWYIDRRRYCPLVFDRSFKSRHARGLRIIYPLTYYTLMKSRTKKIAVLIVLAVGVECGSVAGL